jgi:hypothetical protein
MFVVMTLAPLFYKLFGKADHLAERAGRLISTGRLRSKKGIADIAP